jgi:iron complex transport system substrate-binding protein
MATSSTLLCILVLFTLAPVSAAGPMPGDLNGDLTLTREELSTGILGYLHCIDGDDCTGAPSAQDLMDAARIFSVWEGRPKQVTDSAGKVRTLTRPLHRVVVMNSETLETIRSLDVDRAIVTAVDKYTLQKPEFFPEYAATPSVGSIWAPDYEAILSARPDAVFLYATVSQKECDEIEQKIAGSDPSIIVFRVDCYHPETYLDDVRIIGEIFDRQEEAGHLGTFYTSILDTLAQGLASGEAGAWPSVYFETWTDYKSAGPGSGYQDKIEQAGGRNILGDCTVEYPVVDAETIIDRQPDMMVKLVGSGKYAFGGYSGTNASGFGPARESFTSRPGWEVIPAVQQGRVYLIHNDIFGGPQYIIGEAYLARWFHLELYPDLDPPALHRTYLVEFQGLDGALANPALFVYPVP